MIQYLIDRNYSCWNEVMNTNCIQHSTVAKSIRIFELPNIALASDKIALYKTVFIRFILFVVFVVHKWWHYCITFRFTVHWNLAINIDFAVNNNPDLNFKLLDIIMIMIVTASSMRLKAHFYSFLQKFYKLLSC